MAGKWKKKIKKFAKTAGKAALVAGALYGAAKLGKARAPAPAAILPIFFNLFFHLPAIIFSLLIVIITNC